MILIYLPYYLQNAKCVNIEWVPYDSSISPTDNLYDEPDDLDPQPEFPLRTDLTFYEEIDQPVGLQIDLGQDPIVMPRSNQVVHYHESESNELPVFTIFILWMFGLIVWCVVFVNQGGSMLQKKKRKKKKASSSDSFKDV